MNITQNKSIRRISIISVGDGKPTAASQLLMRMVATEAVAEFARQGKKVHLLLEYFTDELGHIRSERSPSSLKELGVEYYCGSITCKEDPNVSILLLDRDNMHDAGSGIIAVDMS
jgi:hypothetical protein